MVTKIEIYFGKYEILSNVHYACVHLIHVRGPNMNSRLYLCLIDYSLYFLVYDNLYKCMRASVIITNLNSNHRVKQIKTNSIL